jgi:hypothetical protein
MYLGVTMVLIQVVNVLFQWLYPAGGIDTT